MKFSKKPMTIEAVQYDGTIQGIDKIREFAGHWLNTHNGIPHITTPNGLVLIDKDDWIIKGSTPGDFYPCKPNIFVTLYDPID